ncbi:MULTISPECIES: hypothetical protein [unclassified Caballeronia]|uniref:hypothetical protein n=1 Tax=unclassified Caballeronia TaxID=2646786 RepID=UPI0013EA3919|nr:MULTISPECIES: hypothetical protein [unclassified Caballeronia]
MTIRLRTSTRKVIENATRNVGTNPGQRKQIFSQAVAHEPCENNSALELCAIAGAGPAVKHCPHLLYPELPDFPKSLDRSHRRPTARWQHGYGMHPVANVSIDIASQRTASDTPAPSAVTNLGVS